MERNVSDRIKVALYARVSTEEQKENFSLAVQLDLLRKNAVSHQYEIFNEYIDAGFSATGHDRPGFQRLLQDAEAKKFQLVLVYRLDRFFRNTKALLIVSDHLEKLGTGIRSITEPFDTSTHFGKFALSLFGSMAQLERDLFLERSRLGRLRRAQEGYYSGAQPAKFGYHYHRETEKLEIDDKESQIVQMIFRLYSEPCSSLRKIALRLNQIGHKTKKGNLFESATIHDVLRDPIYTGKWFANRYFTGGKLKPQNEWIEVKVPALISEALFLKTQELLRRRRNYSIRNAKYKYLLQGLIRCGDCGCTVAGSADKQYQVKKGKNYGPYFKLYYRCTHFTKNRYGKRVECSLRYIQAELLEETVWKKIEEVFKEPDFFLKYLGLASDDEREHALEWVRGLQGDWNKSNLETKKGILHLLDTKVVVYPNGIVNIFCDLPTRSIHEIPLLRDFPLSIQAQEISETTFFISNQQNNPSLTLKTQLPCRSRC